MSKYSDFKDWVDGVNALSDEERLALIKSSMLLPEFGGDEAITDQDESTRTPRFLEDAVAAIMYADHVTAKMQAEIDARQAAFEAQADTVGRLLHALHSTTEADGLLVIAGLNMRVNRLQVGNARYTKLRRLNVVQFQALYKQAVRGDLPFDELVDQIGGAK
jgi:hypothetical protein